MVPRQNLQQVLEDICDNVYFQPPSNAQMQYPAIVYQKDRLDTKHANDLPYKNTKHYFLTLISRNPDEPLFDELAALPMCAHERSYVADNLNHDAFNIYF